MMFRFVFAIVFICLAILARAQGDIDIQHYEFNITLNDKNDTIIGAAEIKVKFLHPVKSFPVDLVLQNEKGKGMIVDQITVNDVLSENFSKQREKLIINLPQSQQTDSAIVSILYHGVPADGLIISKNKYGDRTFFADNWPNRAHNWIPCKDDPDDKASFEFIVYAPSEYQVVSNGKLAEEKIMAGNKKVTHWVEDVSLSTKVMVIGVAKFAVNQFADSPPNIPVSAWTYPQDSVTGFRNYSVAPAILKFYSDYIGAYPYNKLANVQSKTIFGGMENASAIFYYEESAEENKSMEDLLAHEIAHQWFGDMASEKSFSHLWLSEGFATYMTDIYLESKYGTDSMNRRLRDERKTAIDFARHSNRPVVDSLSFLMNLLNANSYQKGGWILHMLRREMGDTLFRKFIRTYYDRYKGTNADTDDLEKIAEEVSKKDLHQFFKQWLYTPGIPQLNIRWLYNEKDKTVAITIEQVQKQMAFGFPLQIKSEGDKSEIFTLNITRRIETFSIPASSTIRHISADPNTALLFDSRIEKINP